MKIFYSQTELASYLGCSQAVVSKWVGLGLPYDLRGIHYEFELGAVLDWLATRSKRHRAWVEKLELRLRGQLAREAE